MSNSSKKKVVSKSKPRWTSKSPTVIVRNDKSLVAELRELIANSRENIARTVNSELVQLYWQIGTRIRAEVLNEQRADYGKKILATVSRKLEAEFGSGFSQANLAKMLLFAEVFTDGEILLTLSTKLTWSHFVELIRIKETLVRDFYAELCRLENWSVRTLRAKRQSMLFVRTAISKKPDELIRKELADLREDSKLSPNLVFRDPYFLDFLGLKDTYSEKDLEGAILRELESFILELGSGFAFVEHFVSDAASVSHTSLLAQHSSEN